MLSLPASIRDVVVVIKEIHLSVMKWSLRSRTKLSNIIDNLTMAMANDGTPAR
jgi:hypothetical protein